MRKKKGQKGIIPLKVHIEKAYNPLSWNFICDTLEDARFGNEWVHNIMGCVNTARLAVLWNGEHLDWISLS